MNEKNILQKINYKDYPEYMFAMIAAYLPKDEAHDLRRVAGRVVFRHDKDGCTYKNGLLHSYSDKPAYTCGKYQVWYRDGKLHRESDRPALINGDLKQWYKDGLLHRDGDNPAYINGDSLSQWYKNGRLHRNGDNPAYVQADCLREWYNEGLLHREGGPAVVNRSRQEWYKNGIRME
jgi:hypothetical protein